MRWAGLAESVIPVDLEKKDLMKQGAVIQRFINNNCSDKTETEQVSPQLIKTD